MRIQILILGFEGLIDPSTVIFNLLVGHICQNPSTQLKRTPSDLSRCKFNWYRSSTDLFNVLFKIGEGITFAKKVVAMGDEKELSSRGYLALGIGYSLQSCEGRFLLRLFTHGLQASSEFENRETRRVVREQREKPWSFAAHSRGVTFADSWQLVSYIITNFLGRKNFLPIFLYLSFVIHVSLFHYRLFSFLFTS